MSLVKRNGDLLNPLHGFFDEKQQTVMKWKLPPLV